MITYNMNRLLAAARTTQQTTGTTDIFAPVVSPVYPVTRQPTDGFTVVDTNTNVFTQPQMDSPPVPPPTPGGVKPPPTPGKSNTQTFFVLGVAALALYFLAK